MPELLPRDSQPDGRGRFVLAGYAALGIILFAVFLFATFPYSSTLSKILKPMGLEISSRGQSINFPFGAELTDVRLTSSQASSNQPGSDEPILESPSVTIAPSIMSLLMLHPGVNVKASLYDGIARVTARPSGNGTALDFNLDNLNLALQHAFTIPLIGTLGELSGRGAMWISPNDFAANIGEGQLSAAGLMITAAIVSGPIRMGNAQTAFNLKNGVLTIENFKNSGGEVAMTANGTVMLAEEIGDCELAIQFTLVATPDATRRLNFIFSNLPHPPGPEPYRLTGTIASPELS
jgi:type II secretion system protein N